MRLALDDVMGRYKSVVPEYRYKYRLHSRDRGKPTTHQFLFVCLYVCVCVILSEVKKRTSKKLQIILGVANYYGETEE